MASENLISSYGKMQVSVQAGNVGLTINPDLPEGIDILSGNIDLFYFLDDDESPLNEGNYIGDYGIIKIPYGFQNVKVVDGQIEFGSTLTSSFFGPILYNIFEDTQEIRERESNLFEIQSPGIALQGLGGGACPKLIRYEGNRKQKTFKYRNHFFMPLVLTNQSICFYAFEQENTVIDWYQKIDDFVTKKLNNPAEHQQLQMQVAAEYPIIYDNILGMHLIRKASLEEVEVS